MVSARRIRCAAERSHWPPTLQRLVWVVAGLALSVVPHVPHIRLWILLLGAGAAGLRIVIEVKHWRAAAEMAAQRARVRRAARRAARLPHAERHRCRHCAADRDGGHEAARDAHGARSHGDRLPLLLRAVRRVPLQPEPAAAAVHARHGVAADGHADAHPSDDDGDVGARGRRHHRQDVRCSRCRSRSCCSCCSRACPGSSGPSCRRAARR